MFSEVKLTMHFLCTLIFGEVTESTVYRLVWLFYFVHIELVYILILNGGKINCLIFALLFTEF